MTSRKTLTQEERNFCKDALEAMDGAVAIDYLFTLQVGDDDKAGKDEALNTCAETLDQFGALANLASRLDDTSFDELIDTVTQHHMAVCQ